MSISRSAGKISLPCSVMLVCAMNPCPCGYAGSSSKQCRCSIPQIQRYRSRISGPLLDRIDLHVETPALRIEELRDASTGESSQKIRQRCETARSIQIARFKKNLKSKHLQCKHDAKEIRNYCRITNSQGELLQNAMEELHLSARAYNRILKVARTIADLSGEESVNDSVLRSDPISALIVGYSIKNYKVYNL